MLRRRKRKQKLDAHDWSRMILFHPCGIISASDSHKSIGFR